jgi:hypothetical protein
VSAQRVDEESVRAANALAVAAWAGRFGELRREMFADPPPEHSGRYTAGDLVDLGSRVGYLRQMSVIARRGEAVR